MQEYILVHYKPKSFQGPYLCPGPWSHIACFAHATLLCYVHNFQLQKLGPSLGIILDSPLCLEGRLFYTDVAYGYTGSLLWLIHTAQEPDGDQDREWDWVSDQCEYFYMVLYFPFGPCISPVAK